MRVLFLCSKYHINPDNQYLTNTLVNEFRLNGHQVSVFCMGDIDLNKRYESESDILIPSLSKIKFLKFILLWPISCLTFVRKYKKNDFDILFSAAPNIVLTPIVLLSFRLNIKRKITYVTDIFPIHQNQISHVSFVLVYFLKFIESSLIRKFDVIFGMSKMNLDFISKYYNVNTLKTKIDILNIWGVDLSLAHRSFNFKKNNLEKIDLVFGGQLVKGRMIEFLIEFIVKLRELNLNIELTIFSEGNYFEQLKIKYFFLNNFIHFKKKINRSEYINELTKYHCGAIVTDPRVSTPTFPSKIIDYINSGLRCFCIVEESSDIDVEIHYPDFLFVNRFDISDAEIMKAKLFFEGICGNNLKTIEANRFSNFTVNHAYRTIINS